MGRTHTIVADGNSAVTQFIDLLIRQRDLLEQAAQRDAEALRILTAPGLPEAARRVEGRYWANQYGHAERRVWTRRDERRLGWIRGWTFGWHPGPCRVERLLERFGDAHLDAYRLALGEVRRDGTAAVVSPKLAAAKDNHDRLLSHARELTQWESTPLPALASAFWEESHAVAVSQLTDEAPLPKAPPPPDPDGPVDGFRWRRNGVVIQDKMPPMAWRLANHLFHCSGNAADYAALAPIINDDHSETMLDYSNCRGHRDKANVYFRCHGIPWELSLRGKPTLTPTE